MTLLKWTWRQASTSLLLASVLLLGMAMPSHAQQVLLPNQEYSERHTELSVQTLAGPVRIQRTWTAGQWYINPAWANLRLIPDPLGGVLAVERAGSVYERTGSLAGTGNAGGASSSSTGRIYRFDSDNLIETRANGWRWYDRLGNSITYNAVGAIQSYSNANGAAVSFVRDAQGRLSEVRGPQDRVLYRFDYDSGGRISRITDLGSASVQYRWNAAGQLDQVTDSEGQLWQYDYDGHSQITKRTNPAGASIQVTYSSKPTDLPSVAGFAGMGSGASDGGQSGAAASSSGGTKAPSPHNARVASLQDESGARWSYRIEYNRSRQEYGISTQRPDGSSSLGRYNREGWNIFYSLQDQVQFQRIIDSATQHRVIDARGNTTTVYYDSSQQPLRFVYPDGTAESYQYDAQGRRVRYTNALGAITTWRYDTHGNVLEVVNAAGLPEQRTHRYSYDQWGNALTYSRGAGDGQQADARTEQAAYDNAGNARQWTNAAGKSWSYTHDTRGSVLTETDPLGATWKATYDTRGATLRSEDPLGRTRVYQYNSTGFPTAFTDAMARAWQLAYDPAGRLTQLTDPLGNAWKKSYDALGRNTQRANPSGQQARTKFDELGRQTEVTDPASNATRYEYGASGGPLAGLRTATAYPTFRETYRYDQRGRTTQATQVLDASTSRTTYYAWDGLGQNVGITDPAGNATLYRYDALGRATAVVDSLNQGTQQTWNAHDEVVSVTDAKGNTHHYDYDKAGRRTQERRPGEATTSYQYDATGQLTLRTDAGGNTRSYQYNSAGELISEELRLAGTNVDQSITYQHNANGLLSQYEQTDAAGQRISAVTYQRDSLGRVTQRAIHYGQSISHTLGQSFDADGQLVADTYPDGSKGQYTYTQGRISQVQLPNASTITYQGYQWFKPTRIQSPGGIKTLTFDPLMRTSSLQVQGAGNQVLASRQYQYDLAGNIGRITSDLGQTDYGHDPIGRLTKAQPDATLQNLGLPIEQFAYDPVHNRISSAHQPGAWSYNQDNQLTQYPQRKKAQSLATQVKYNSQGHTQSETNEESTKTYSYNAAERLTRYEEKPSSGAGPSTQASYRYDPYGRRISKTVTKGTTPGTTSQTTYYLYGDNGLLAELNAQGVMTRAYGWDPATAKRGLWSTEPLWQAEVSPQNPSLSAPGTSYHYLHTDHLATPIVATNKTGAQSWKAISESFGQMRVDNASAITMNLRFPGQYFDEESGGHYNFHRDYRPELGRYGERDPIGLAGGINTYGYVGSRPLRYLDSSGQFAQVLLVCATPGGALLCAATAAAAIQACSSTYNAIDDWMHSDSADGGGAGNPGLPTDIVGDQSDPDKAGPNKKGGKWTSGPLTPENGGTGDYDKDLDKLTGGTRPYQPGDKAQPGSQVGPNGIFGRNPNSSGGRSIDIPGNGTKPHETLHYP